MDMVDEEPLPSSRKKASLISALENRFTTLLSKIFSSMSPILACCEVARASPKFFRNCRLLRRNNLNEFKKAANSGQRNILQNARQQEVCRRFNYRTAAKWTSLVRLEATRERIRGARSSPATCTAVTAVAASLHQRREKRITRWTGPMAALQFINVTIAPSAKAAVTAQLHTGRRK